MEVQELEAFSVNPEQASLLQTGLSIKGIERVQGNPARLNTFLDAVAHREEDETADIPVDLVETARGVAKLILKTELTHLEALVAHGRVEEIEIRDRIGRGFNAKFSLLKGIVDERSAIAFAAVSSK